MAWLAGWDKRIELTIGDYAGDIGAEVVWFPVTIFLKDANGDSTKVFEEVTTNSRKIAITKADGETELKGEIEQWNYDAGTPANSVAVIHTSADGWVINANTSIFLYYDNDHDVNANIDVINTVAGATVWDDDFKFVCHMVDDNGNVDDSTSNNNDGTKKGPGEPAEATGKVGKGQDFAGDDDYIFASTPISAYPFTVEAWFEADSVVDESIIHLNDASDNTTYYGMRLIGGKLQMDARGSGQISTTQSVAAINADTWYYAMLVFIDSTHRTLYINGALDQTSPDEVAFDTDVDTQLIGLFRLTTPGDYFDGIIDEPRISSVVRTLAWAKGTYNSENDSLLTYGSEEVKINALFFGSNF